MFLHSVMNRKSLMCIFFSQEMFIVKILPTKFKESLMYQLYTAKEMQMVLFVFQSFFQCANVTVLIVSALKLFMEEQLEHMEELSSIVLSMKDDVLRTVDWRSELQACVWKTAVDF